MYGWTALKSASNKGHVECLKELINAGADINKEDKNGGTALIYCFMDQDRIECLKELIAAGADLNKEDKNGQTALKSASNKGHDECLKELIAAGADLNKENKRWWNSFVCLLQKKVMLNA